MPTFVIEVEGIPGVPSMEYEVPNEQFEQIQAAADARGQSIVEWMEQMLGEQIARFCAELDARVAARQRGFPVLATSKAGWR